MKNKFLIGISVILLVLLIIIKADTDSKKTGYSLKEDSTLFSFFSDIFKNDNIAKGLEADLTKDNKAELVFITSSKTCPNCKQRLTIYNGNKKIFEVTDKDLDLIPKQGGFLLKSATTSKAYIWTDKGFVADQDLTLR